MVATRTGTDEHTENYAMNTKPSYSLFASLAITGLAVSTFGGVVLDPVQRLSHIETAVTANVDGTYTYRYRVVNDSPAPQFTEEVEAGSVEVWPAIVGYEIPLDDPSLVWSIASPETWGYRFLSAGEYEQEYGQVNPFNSAYVLQWYDTEFFEGAKTIAPNGYNQAFNASEYEPYADGFAMTSRLGPVDGPYANLWADFFRNIGDPPLPGGNISGGTLPYTPLIPEPPATAFGVVSLVGLTVLVWYQRRMS
jgi:hypothetical protein